MTRAVQPRTYTIDWSAPATLRRQLPDEAEPCRCGRVEDLEVGTLADMVSRARTLDPAIGPAVFIVCDPLQEPLHWTEICECFRRDDFPFNL